VKKRDIRKMFKISDGNIQSFFKVLKTIC
jgi:hypothetical protein